MTNSEQVLWRKDEKTKLKDLEIVYLKDLKHKMCYRVPFA